MRPSTIMSAWFQLRQLMTRPGRGYLSRWGFAVALACLICLCLLATAAALPGAATPPPSGFEAHLGQIVLPEVTLANASPADIAAFLEKTCRQYADRGGYRVNWSVAKSALASEPLLMVDIRDAPLAAVVTALASACDLQVNYTDGELRIADQTTPIDPLLTREFRVLPTFWTAVRENATKDLPPGAEFAPEQVTEFLTATGMTFPTGAALQVAADHSLLQVVNTPPNLDLLRQLLRLTYTGPFRWELQARLIQVTDEKVFNAPAPAGSCEYYTAEQILARLAEKKAGQVLAESRFDALQQTLMRDEQEFRVAAADQGQGKCLMTVQPQQVFYDYGALRFDLSLDCRISDDDRPVYEHTLKTALALASNYALRLRLPSVQVKTGPPVMLYMLLSLQLKHDETEPSAVAANPAVRESRDETTVRKLQSLVIPKVEFEELTVLQMVNWLRQRSRELDPDGKGVSINLVVQAGEDNRPLTMSMNNIPLWEVIRYVSMACGLKYQIRNGMVWLIDKTGPLEPVEVRLSFFDQEVCSDDFLYGNKAGAANDGTMKPVRFDRQAVSARLKPMMQDFGVDLSASSWLRVFRFPLGHLLATRTSADDFRKIQMIFQMLDGELWWKSQIRMRVQLVEITDPALAQKVIAALDQSADRRQYMPVPRLIPGKGVKILDEGEVLALDGYSGEAQWNGARDGKSELVRLKCSPKVAADGYTITSSLNWHMGEPVVDNLKPVACGWSSTCQMWDGEPIVLRAPSLAGPGVAADHTFLMLTAAMINTLGLHSRSEFGDTEPDENKTDNVAPVESQPDQRETQYYSITGNVSQVADILSFVTETTKPLVLETLAGIGKMLVSGGLPDLVQVDTIIPVESSWGPQFKIAVAGTKTPSVRTELLAVPEQDATVTLPPLTEAGHQFPLELSFRLNELVHTDLYHINYTLRRAPVIVGNDNPKPVSGTMQLHNGVPTSVPVDPELSVTVESVNPAGWRLAKPFAAAVDLHQRLHQDRQQRVADSAKQLEACVIPEFRMEKADLKTAVEKLAAECRRLQFPPPAANLAFVPPAEVQIAEKQKIAELEELVSGEVPEREPAEKIVARRQKPVPQRKADLDLRGKNLAEILRQLQAAYACRIDVQKDAIQVSPVPDLALHRFSVAKAILKEVGTDLPNFFTGHGVTFQDTDRVLYVPDQDTLLAFGSDTFLDAVARVLAAQDVPRRSP